MTIKEYLHAFTPYAIGHALLNVTDGCNLRCRYCFTNHNPRRMKLQTAKDAVKFIWENRGESPFITISFFGGEPMLEYETIIKPLVEWAKDSEYNVHWGMTTNGTLFTEERLDWCKKNGVGFLLSIDGDKATQDYNRPCVNGGSSFDLVAPMLPKIIEKFPFTTFRSTGIPETTDKIVDNYLFARKMGFRDYYIMPNVMQRWTDEEIKAYNNQIETIYNIMYRDITYGFVPLRIHNVIKTYKCYFGQERSPSIRDCYRCGLGLTTVGIGVNGEIFGCQEHSTYSDLENDLFYIGTIYDGINPERHIHLLEEFCKTAHLIPEEPEMCENCIRKKWCNSLHCPSHNWNNFGDIRKQDRMTCLYRAFEDEMALRLLARAQEEGNQKYCQWVELCINEERGKNYAV